MDFTGRILGLSKDWETDRWQITFSMNEESALQTIQDLNQTDKLAIHVVKWRKKRSNDANAYLWVLCDKIAQVIKTSKEEVYEEMLQKYGNFYSDDNGYVVVTVKSDVNMSKVGGHWKFYKRVGDFSSYLMLKGSSDMDTKEMSNLLDGIISEAKELGIQTETQDEIGRMLEQWAKSIR